MKCRNNKGTHGMPEYVSASDMESSPEIFIVVVTKNTFRGWALSSFVCGMQWCCGLFGWLLLIVTVIVVGVRR